MDLQKPVCYCTRFQEDLANAELVKMFIIFKSDIQISSNIQMSTKLEKEAKK